MNQNHNLSTHLSTTGHYKRAWKSVRRGTGCVMRTDGQTSGSYSPLCAAVLQTGLKSGNANIAIVPAANGKTAPTFRTHFKYNRRKLIPCYNAASITRFLCYSETNKTERKMAQQVVTFHGLQEHRGQTADRTKGWHPCSINLSSFRIKFVLQHKLYSEICLKDMI